MGRRRSKLIVASNRAEHGVRRCAERKLHTTTAILSVSEWQPSSGLRARKSFEAHGKEKSRFLLSFPVTFRQPPSAPATGNMCWSPLVYSRLTPKMSTARAETGDT